MSITALVSLANEFEQVSQDSLQTMPGSGPVSKIEPTQKSPSSEPVTVRPPADEPYTSTMDFRKIADKLHLFVSEILEYGDRIGFVKNTDYAGHYFGVVSRSPARAQHIYKRIVLFLRDHLPTNAGNSSAGHGWLELRYPEEDAVITLLHHSQDVTFKITTIEQ